MIQHLCFDLVLARGFLMFNLLGSFSPLMLAVCFAVRPHLVLGRLSLLLVWVQLVFAYAVFNFVLSLISSI
jgi:hypothetical protein